MREIFVGASGSRRETVTTYDSATGQLATTLSPRGLLTTHKYDAAGREVTTIERAEGRDILTRRGYDPSGRTLWTQTPLQAQAGKFSTYRYNLAVSSSDPAYAQLLQVYHEDDNINTNDNASYVGYYEAYGYDDKGRQTDVTKLMNVRGVNQPVTTHTDYDAEGRAEFVIFNYLGENVTAQNENEENVTFQFTYDADGNRDSVIYPSGITKKWDHIYNDDSEDDLDRLIETQPGPSGSAPPWKTTLFNDYGQEELITDNVGNKIASFYDDFRLDRKTYTLADMTPAFNHRYSYDDLGRLDEIKTFDGDGESNLLRTESRVYNPETDRLSSVVKDEGTIHYSYDDSGSLASMSYYGRTVSYEYDFWGRLSRATSPEAQWAYQYNDAGQKIRVDNIEKETTEERTYDPLGRVLSVRHTSKGEAEPIFEIEYALAPDGNRIGATETRGTEGVTWAYQYDALGRLTRETRTAGTNPRDVSYTYDSDGNRTTETDELIAVTDFNRRKDYFYEPNSHRLDRIERNGVVLSDFEWTANGEQQTKTENGQTHTYIWGPDGTLRSVEFSTGERVEYDYDSFGELIRRREFAALSDTPASDRRYLIDSQNLTGYTQRVAEIDAATGAIQTLNTVTDQIAAQSMTRPDNTMHSQYHHTDELGSIRALTDDSIVESYDYKAFGSTISGNFSLTSYAFTGQLSDRLTSLQYHRARWLHERWLSADPVFDFPNNFGNALGYAGQNPISNTDPSGTLTLLEKVGVLVSKGYLIYDTYSNVRDIIAIATTLATGGSVSVLQISLLLVGLFPGFPNLNGKSRLVQGILKRLPEDEFKLIQETVKRYGRSGKLQDLGEGVLHLTGCSRFIRIAGYAPRYRGYDNVFKNGDRYVIGEAKTTTGSLVSRTYSTRSGERIRTALGRRQNQATRAKVREVVQRYGIDTNAKEHVQGKAGWVLDYALRLKDAGDPVGEQVLNALQKGKVDWYEVGVKLDAKGIPSQVDEIYRALN